jgi:two-component system sensor histidine kinase HupT/HoxJ
VDLATVEVLGREPQLVQVLENLLNNAFDAVEEIENGSAVVRITRQSETLVIEVHDNGPKISPEVQAKMFHPFFTTKPVGHGTGLGLSVSLGILQEHKASIELRQNESMKAFVITMPLHRVS